jgi:hypothetical protein
MMKQIPLITFAAYLATFLSIGTATAQAKQQCSAEMPPNSHMYWSWRLIDGRKCWYEGKPMLSKSLLEWPAQGSAQPDTDKPSNPLDSQAWAPTDTDTFDARWRARVEQH